ncbi:DUF5708 family protein [Streptomyces sp. G45]|uniref:DUF5708 family protein n=1 Tax=Streptomyces sp. G45 TaxID=3406627 RepID=UPI003C1DF5F2
MGKASKNLVEGVATFVVGLALRLFADGVETPVVTLTKVGVVLMCLGAVIAVLGVSQAVRSRVS